MNPMPHLGATREVDRAAAALFGAAVFVAALFTAVLVAGCGPGGGARSQRIVRGDTTIVLSHGAGSWSAPRRFVEELAIGELEGDEVYTFGAVLQIAPDPSGGAYVFDMQVPAIRQYDADGRYVRTLGGPGSGPGEYQDILLAMQVRADGRLMVRDPRNMRLTLYHPDGMYSTDWRVNSGLYTDDAMFLDAADHAFLKILTNRPQPNERWTFGLLHLDAMGAVLDTIPEPVIAGEPDAPEGRFSPTKIWTLAPSGAVVVGLNGRYEIELRHSDGAVARILRSHEPVELASGERQEYEAVNEWYRTYQGRSLASEIPPVPTVKPAFRALTVASDGRLWVQLYRPAVKDESIEPRAVDAENPPRLTWREPAVYDVFDPDGTYLGQASVPDRTTILRIQADTAWGTRLGDAGEQYVVRLRLGEEQAAS